MLVVKIPTTQRVEESRSNGNYDLVIRLESCTPIAKDIS